MLVGRPLSDKLSPVLDADLEPGAKHLHRHPQNSFSFIVVPIFWHVGLAPEFKYSFQKELIHYTENSIIRRVSWQRGEIIWKGSGRPGGWSI